MNSHWFDRRSREQVWIKIVYVISHPLVQPRVGPGDGVHPHPDTLGILLLIEMIHVLLEGLGDHPGMGVPQDVVENRPDRRPVLDRKFGYPSTGPELYDVVYVEGLRDVLGDVVDRIGVPLDSHVVRGERIYVDEPDLPDRTLAVPVLEVLPTGEDATCVWIRRIGTV